MKTRVEIVLDLCSEHCGFRVEMDTPMKTMGYLDSLSNMELLTSMSNALKTPINWKANFSTLNSPKSYIDILFNESEHWKEAFCDPFDEEDYGRIVYSKGNR